MWMDCFRIIKDAPDATDAAQQTKRDDRGSRWNGMFVPSELPEVSEKVPLGLFFRLPTDNSARPNNDGSTIDLSRIGRAQ